MRGREACVAKRLAHCEAGVVRHVGRARRPFLAKLTALALAPLTVLGEVVRRAPWLAHLLMTIVLKGRGARIVTKAARAALAHLAVRLLGSDAAKVLAVFVRYVVCNRRLALLGGSGRQCVARTTIGRTPDAAFALAPWAMVRRLRGGAPAIAGFMAQIALFV